MNAVWRLTTIRARLVAGFGISITLLLAAGLLGWYGLSRSNRDAEQTVRALAERSEFIERTTNTVLRELVAGLRYLSTGRSDDEQGYRGLVAQAEQLRTDILGRGALAAAERRHLERLGQLQAALEVRIAVTRAWQVAGNAAGAERVLAQTTRDIELIEDELQALRNGARQSADASMERMRHALFTSEASLVVVVALAFGVAAFFGLSTARAVADPLVQLRDEMMAIGAGDLREPFEHHPEELLLPGDVVFRESVLEQRRLVVGHAFADGGGATTHEPRFGRRSGRASA